MVKHPSKMRRGRTQPRSARSGGTSDDDAKAAASKTGMLAPLLFLAIGVVFVVSTLYLSLIHI